MTTININVETKDRNVRALVTCEGQPVEGTVVNFLAPEGVRFTPRGEKFTEVKSAFPLENPTLGPCALLAASDLTLYPGNVYIFETELSAAVKGRVEVSGWADETVSAEADFTLE